MEAKCKPLPVLQRSSDAIHANGLPCRIKSPRQKSDKSERKVGKIVKMFRVSGTDENVRISKILKIVIHWNEFLEREIKKSEKEREKSVCVCGGGGGGEEKCEKEKWETNFIPKYFKVECHIIPT